MPTHARARRLVGGLLTVALALPVSAGAAAAQVVEARATTGACEVAARSSFVDRPTEAFGTAVDCVAFYRITTGTTAGSFSPQLPITRGQMASFLVRTAEVAGHVLPSPATDAFTDDDGSVHEAAINRVAAAGIASGFADRTFRPAAPVSRAQVATLVAGLLRRAGGTDLPAPTADHFTDDDGSPHEVAIGQLAEIGVVTGRGDRSFAPGDAVTRGQMALVVARALDWLTAARSVPLARIGVTDATAAPELVAATATAAGATTVVTLTFDDEVAPTVVTGAVQLVAFDGSVIPASAATRDTADRRRVRATFPAAEARLATTASVGRGAVSGLSAIPGPEGAAPLQAIELLPGTTDAPDLFSVTRVGAAAVDFNFDEPAFLVRPTGYRLLLADGTVRRSSAASGDGTTTHTVTFPDLSGDDAARVVRAVIDPGTVSDVREADGAPVGGQAAGALNPQQAVAVAAGGAMAGIPDLVRVAVDPGRDEVRYTFDEPLAAEVGPAARFRAYDLGAREVTGVSATRAVGDDRSVVVRFGTGTLSGLTAGASVDDAGVRSVAGLANRADERGLPRSFAPGHTAAPDLVRAGRVQQPGGTGTIVRRVVFEFDQPLTLGVATAFSVYAASGERTPLTGCRRAGPLAVACEASAGTPQYAAIGGASLAGVERGAVSDLTGIFHGHADAAVL